MKFKVTFLLSGNNKNPLVFNGATRVKCRNSLTDNETDLEGDGIQAHEYNTYSVYRLYADGKALGIVDGWTKVIAAIKVEQCKQ